MYLFDEVEFLTDDVLMEALDSFEKRRRLDDERICLPPEILILIFSYLGIRELCRVQQVCKMYRQVACDDTLWKLSCHREWPLSKEVPFQSEWLETLGWRFRCILASGIRIIGTSKYASTDKTMAQVVNTDEGMEYATWAIKLPDTKSEPLLMFIQYLKDTGFRPVKIVYSYDIDSDSDIDSDNDSYFYTRRRRKHYIRT